MTPGTVESTLAGRTLHFEVGDGWSADRLPVGAGFQLLRNGADLDGFSASEFDGTIFPDPCSGSDTDLIGATPQDFIDFLAARDGITVVAPPAAVVMGSETAQQVDIAVVPAAGCPESPNFLLRTPQGGDFHLQVGEQARVVVIGAGEHSIVVVFESSSQAGFDALMQLAMPILASMTVD